MAKIKIRIEAVSINDPYYREHAKGIDQPLNNTGHWRATQPDKFLGIIRGTTVHEETVELSAGRHYVEYAVSGYVPNYAWHAKIYINDKLFGEGDVGRRTHLRVNFLVGLLMAWPIPSPLLPGRRCLMPAMLS